MKKEKKGERGKENATETNALIEKVRQRQTVCDCKKKEEKIKNRGVYKERKTQRKTLQKAARQLFPG